MTSQTELQRCAQECLSCEKTCLETINYCINKGGQHVEAKHLQLLMNCIEICQTSAKFLTSGSKLHMLTCDACAKVCEVCADSCDQFKNDAEMKKCVDACRNCAASCKRMSPSAQAA
jgi:hypothetical protein